MYDFDVFLILHNRLELTINCINALYENTKQFNFRLTVLDDSTDETPQYFKRISQEKGNIQYIQHGRPFKNWDEMFNLGIANTDCPIFITLNNSCTVEPVWVGSILKLMEQDKDIGIGGIKSLQPNGLIECAGVLIYGDEIKCVGLGEAGHRYSFVYEPDAIGSNCCLFRREMAKNGFDFSYYVPFGGYEDIDFCLQMKERGWKIMYCGYGAVYHIGKATRGQRPEFEENTDENMRRFTKRWGHLLAREISQVKFSQ